MEIKEILDKLIGATSATGDSSRDGQRLENLKTKCNLIEELIEDVRFSARDKDSWESSVKGIGQYADKFLIRLKEELL